MRNTTQPTAARLAHLAPVAPFDPGTSGVAGGHDAGGYRMNRPR
jgi:hypothetical protein